MEYQIILPEKKIRFEISAAVPDLIDQFAFVHLVTMKFGGDEVSARSWGKGKKRRYLFTVVFPDWDACSQAQSHCGRNLSPDGDILEDYRGALDRADPARTMSRAMKERAENAELNE